MKTVAVTFPFLIVLKQEPGNEYARHHMTVGEVYVARGLAGSCLEVSTNLPGDWTMVHPDRFDLYN